MTEATFSANLESVREGAFIECHNLERVTIPLKKNLIMHDREVFAGCRKMVRVDLVEDEVLQNTVDVLNLEEWRNDVIEEIDSINLILPNTDDGYYDEEEDEDYVDLKSMKIQNWTNSLCGKIIRATKCSIVSCWKKLQLLSSLPCPTIL